MNSRERVLQAFGKIRSLWKVSFVRGGPTIPLGFSTIEPKLWTEAEKGKYQWFADTAHYPTVFCAVDPGS
jgi:hypothetical protein